MKKLLREVKGGEANIISVWEYYGGEEPGATMYLLKNCNIEINKENNEKQTIGQWSITTDNVIIINIDSNYRFWDNVIVKTDKSIVYESAVIYDPDKRLVGFKIQQDKFSGKYYINYFGKMFYRK